MLALAPTNIGMFRQREGDGLSGPILLNGSRRNSGVPEPCVKKKCDVDKKTLAFDFLRE